MKSKTLPALHLLTFSLLTASQAHAANITWADSAGNTTWTTSNTFNATPTSASWLGGVAPTNNIATDNAIFNSVSNAQPALTVQTRIAGVDFQMATGGLAMTGGGGSGNLFQLGTGGIDSSLQTSGTNTITNARILLNAASTWSLFSSADTASTSTFTFDSTVDLSSQSLTVVGQRNSAANNVGVINFNRAIAGTGTLTIHSSSTNNTVNLTGNNTYTGLTTVSTGIVNVQNDQSAATGGWSIVTLSGSGVTQAATVSLSTGSTLAVASLNKIQLGTTANGGTYANSTLNVAGTVTNSGALQLERAGILNLNNGAIWTQSGNQTVTARGGASATLNVNAGAQMTYNGSSTVKLNNSGTSGGSGSFNINGTGQFTSAAGFENTSAVTTGNGISRVTLTDGGTLKLSADVANLTTNTRFNLAGTGGVIDNGGFSTTLSGAFSGSVANTTTGITGTGGLTSTGSGTLTLSGSNTYTGDTLVSAGTLLVTGSLASNSNVTVDANATFGGTGTVGGNLGFDKDSSFQIVNLNTPLTVTGTVSFGTGFGVSNLLGIDWDALTLDTPYTLISSTQTFTDLSIGNFGIDNAADVGTGRKAYFQNGSLQLVVVPEPATALLGGMGLAFLLRRRRN
jgi:autotransporter-associated beta strand protein